MSREQLLGLIRHALTVAGGYVIAQGVADEATVAAVVGAVMTLIGVAWSFVAPEKK